MHIRVYRWLTKNSVDSRVAKLKALILGEHLPLLLCLLYFVALAPFAEGFATSYNLINVFSAMLPLLVLASGQTIVMIAAGIDLSATAVVGLASVVGAMIMSGDTGWLAGNPLAVPTAIIAMLFVGAFVGAVNGTLIAWFRLPPFIVTLTSLMFFSGLAIWSTQSNSISALPSSYRILGGNDSVTLVIVSLALGLTHILLTRSLYGRWIFAIGHNPKTARISGVPVEKVLFFAYVAAGLIAALGSILITSRMESGSPVHWERNLLDVIGATVIGGTSLYGGKGKVLWTIYGALFLTLIDNSLNLLNLSHFTIMMAKGLVILVAATLDALRNREKQ